MPPDLYVRDVSWDDFFYLYFFTSLPWSLAKKSRTKWTEPPLVTEARLLT